MNFRERLKELGGRWKDHAPIPDLGSLKGIGPKRSAQLSEEGIKNILDLLLFLPREYVDRTSPKRLGTLYPDRTATNLAAAHCRAEVIAHEYFYARGRRVSKIWIDDGSTRAALLCFGRPFLAKHMVTGSQWLVAGKFSLHRGELQCSNFEIRPQGDERLFFGIVPHYRPLGEFPRNAVHKHMEEALVLMKTGIEEADESTISKGAARLNLPGLPEALRMVHLPRSLEEAETGRRRLAWAELTGLMARQCRHKNFDKNGDGTKRVRKNADSSPLDYRQKQFVASLPFTLTKDQLRCTQEINADLDAGGMYRLLQGDVGSGKTLVAFLAAIRIVQRGAKAAFMVPTEMLSRQHFAKITALNSGIDVILLNATLPAQDQKRAINRISHPGKAVLVIGTHSLFGSKVKFDNLQLVIIDEQHRFGVNQRNQLSEKAATSNILMLSATPIPRTLTMTIFARLKISTIRGLPSGRLPVVTHLAVIGKEEKVYRAIQAQLEQGGQAYFVYPRIEADEDRDGSSLKSVEEMAALLSRRFATYKVALVHGRLSSEERNSAMKQFGSGEIQILVATSVIEVGVDVANATAIVIEHADRFGLAALHQLRGRVGRGPLQSYCYLVYNASLSEDGKQRLRILKENNDGFKLAEEDLRIRGPGNITGVEQSGYLDLQFASLYRDGDLIEALSQNLEKLAEEVQ